MKMFVYVFCMDGNTIRVECDEVKMTNRKVYTYTNGCLTDSFYIDEIVTIKCEEV